MTNIKILLKLHLYKELLNINEIMLDNNDRSLLYVLTEDKEIQSYIKDNLVIPPVDLKEK